MEQLNQLKCEHISGEEPRLNDTQIAQLHSQVPDWRVIEVEGEKRLERVYKFRNFAEALAFTDLIGQLAEAEDHHPAILTEWGRATVTWWTHKIHGLHRNDFIMAAKSDAAYAKIQV